jgi:hypothetical protein
MSDKTYVIIETDLDGDSYQIHNRLKEAKKAFNYCKKNGTLWNEGTIYLIELKDKKFGITPKGEVYGGEIIKEHQFNS